MADNAAHADMAALSYFDHSTGKRVNTDAVLVEALRTQYPNLDLVIAPEGKLNLLAYAAAGYAKATPIDTHEDEVYGPGIHWRSYMPPARRLDSAAGFMAERVLFGKYMYKWKDQEAILYIADGRDGTAYFPSVVNHYILTNATHKVDDLITEATKWTIELHNEVWVFDQGYWQKSAELYNSVRNASWENVILDEDMKKALISDVEQFFDGQKVYSDLKVPWKRGIIYYGPPGNGKTISIKAMMHTLYQRGKDGDDRLAVPTLYVRSLVSYGGPEYALKLIFSKARQEAPCYLVFEDLDSIVNDRVRSYFLNEVDGLKSNDGILMVGSTNHLDRLDPGISKRPSRFDRKYYFSDPNYDQRVQYAQFWQNKLKDNKDIDFPDKLCNKVAEITDKFSFAYMQEAFIASLLAIAARGGKDVVAAKLSAQKWAGPWDPLNKSNDLTQVQHLAARRQARLQPVESDPTLDKLDLWVEMQKQVKILREEMEEKQRQSTGSALSFQPASQCQDVSRCMPAYTAHDDKRHSMESDTRYRDELDALLHGSERRRMFGLPTDAQTHAREQRFF